MSCVFPGLPDVLARLFRSVIILIKEDFPTLLLPIKAYSGRLLVGHLITSWLLTTNTADLIFIFISLEKGNLFNDDIIVYLD
jgi:hypothetical protein